MSRIVAVSLCFFVSLATLVVAPLAQPQRVLAASGTLAFESPLQDAPTADAAVLTYLPEGAVVSIDGPPVDGYYPVRVGNVTGWMPGDGIVIASDEAVVDSSETLATETGDGSVPDDQAALEPVTETEYIAEDPAVDATGSTAPVETAGTVSSDLAVTEAETEFAPADPNAPVTDAPLTDPATTVSDAPVSEAPVSDQPVSDAPADEFAAPESDPAAPVVDPAMEVSPVDGGEPVMAPDAGGATPVPVDAVVEEPPLDDGAVDPAAVAFPDAGPTGPASTTAAAPILLGPGTEFGQITTAPAGSPVEQTGHLVDGYVTVKYAGITGWVRHDLLGPPLPPPAEPVATDPAAAEPAAAEPAAEAKSEKKGKQQKKKPPRRGKGGRHR